MSYTGSSKKIPVSLLIELITDILKEFRRPIDLYILDLELQRRLGFFVNIQQLRSTLEGSWRFKVVGDKVKLTRNWSRCENCFKKHGRIWLKVNGISLYLCLDCACKLLKKSKVVVEA